MNLWGLLKTPIFGNIHFKVPEFLRPIPAAGWSPETGGEKDPGILPSCICICICTLYVHLLLPRTELTFIFEGQPPQNKAEIPIKTRVIWVLGIYIYLSFSNHIISVHHTICSN